MIGKELFLVVEHEIVRNRCGLDRVDGRERVNDIAIGVAYVAYGLLVNRFAIP